MGKAKVTNRRRKRPVKKKAGPVAKARKPRPELEIEYAALSELERWPRNPKLHDLPGIKASMRRWGFTLPVMLDEATNRLVAGHGRQEALSEMRDAKEPPPKNIHVRDGEWYVPVIRGNEFESEEEAERYLLADNRFVELGGWDEQALLEILAEQEAPDLNAMGFDATEVERLITVREHERRFKTGDIVENPAGEWVGMPEFHQEDKTAYRSIKVHFKDKAAMEAFEEAIGQKLPDNAGYLWYPEMEIERFADKRYAADES